MSFQDDQVFLEKYLDENLNTVLGLRLAGKYISSDNLEGAHLILSEFLESHPNNPTAMFLMGEIAFKEGNNDKAKSHYEDTIQVDPTYVAAYHRLVSICNDDGDEAGVTEIYRLLNLVIPMDKKAASELEGKGEADPSKSDFADRTQNKYLLSPSGDSESSSDSDESTEETEGNVDSLADELSSKLDVEDDKGLDLPLDGGEEEAEETKDSDLSAEDKESDEAEEESVTPDESELEESTDDSSDESVDADSEEKASITEETESVEVDAFGVATGDVEIETESAEEESAESVTDEEKVEEEVSSEEDSVSEEADAFGIGDTSEETSDEVDESSDEDSSDADDTEPSAEEIVPEEDSESGDDETAAEDPFAEEKESDEKSEETVSDEMETSEEITSEKEIDENEPESSTESADKSESELESASADEESDTIEMPPVSKDTLSDVGKNEESKSEIEMPPFSKETLADVGESEESETTADENLESEGEEETDEEKIDEDTSVNVDEGADSLNIPLDSTADATSTEDSTVTAENDSNEPSGDDKSGGDKGDITIDSIEETDKGSLDTPTDFESWVEKDVTPESMTTGEGDANEHHKNTFEGLLSEDETLGEVDTMELPEESAAGLTVDEEEDFQEKIDDIYSLAQIDDDEDASPLQAWFLDKKTQDDDEEQIESQEKEEENPDTITEPKPVPFSGESEEESEALKESEEDESGEKWDKFVDKVVEKKGGDDPKDSDSVSTDIDRELRNIFDEVATPANEQEINEANADAPDITGGVKLNSDLATFTLADIYISQSQFNEALSVLDLLEQKGQNLERVTSMREEIKVKIEARNK